LASPAPLTSFRAGQKGLLSRVAGTPQLRQSLEDLGFVPGAPITVIRRMRQDLVVQVHQSRVAIGAQAAGHVLVTDSSLERPGRNG
jgi:ferrous iron transport protein A